MKRIYNLFLFSFVMAIFSTNFVLADIGSTTAIAIDSLGVLIGLSLLTFLIMNLAPFRGDLRTSYVFLAWGISFQLLALIYTLVFVRFHLLPIFGGIDIHHLLMIIGITFFSFAVFKLREVVKGADETETTPSPA